MRTSLRRELRFLRLYAIGTSLVMVVLCASAFQQATRVGNMGEINVERINVFDKDGTLRMVISNKDRMHPGIMDGQLIDRPRPVAGMLFFNEHGDEVGGLTYTGQQTGTTRRANAGLMFDQLKQDQTIGISYTEGNGQRSAGFQVWDRSETPLSQLIVKLNEANKIEDRTKRDAALASIRASAPAGPRRVFLGKTNDRAASMSLSDAAGRPRLRLMVDAAGNPRIEFLDEEGKVVRTVLEK